MKCFLLFYCIILFIFNHRPIAKGSQRILAMGVLGKILLNLLFKEK